MGIIIKQWEQKYPTIPKDQLMNWLSDAALKGIPPGQYEQYINSKIAESKGIKTPTPIPVPDSRDDEEPEDEEAEESFDSEMYSQESEEESEDSEPEEDEEGEEGELSDVEDSEELPDAYKSQMFPKEELPTDSSFRQEIESFKPKPRNQVKDPDIPFDNPDLSNIQVPEQEEEEEYEEPQPAPRPRPRLKPMFRHNEMVTKTISYQEYDEIMRPFRPFLDDIKKDSGTLHKLAAQIDGRYMPPYMQIKGFILNHPIKDPNNTTLLLSIISEANAKRLEQKYVNITQGVDITRALAEQAYFQDAFNNYDSIVEKLFEDRRALVSLVFILENYCEQKQVSPFELSIPKKVLMDSIEESFQTIKQLITDNVLQEMTHLRSDLKGELGNVGNYVERNMTRFDTSIQEAVTKVLWKVKTDVENTNMEDIKQSLLWILNKRSAGYTLGGAATAILSIMLDDLERRLLATGFKLDDIKEHRRYTVEDLTRALGYKSQTNVVRAIPLLIQRKLVKIYDNKTISL